MYNHLKPYAHRSSHVRQHNAIGYSLVIASYPKIPCRISFSGFTEILMDLLNYNYIH